MTTVRDENEYEDLLAEWSDLESGLAVLLTSPDHAQQFISRVVQYDLWMQGLMERDADVGLYLLFQLAGNSPVGYSASHALVCAVLCHMLAEKLNIIGPERDSMVRAALTMNVAMTRMQDALAVQSGKPTPVQQEMIKLHPLRGVRMLETLGVQDRVWLSIVSGHHDNQIDLGSYQEIAPVVRLTRVVKLVDRYAAMISPRLSRAGRSATESARIIMANTTARIDPVGHAMVRVVGLYPPGTYVRMDSEELGVVVKRSRLAKHPYIAIVGTAEGELLHTPKLHDPAHDFPHIRAALSASGIRAQLNHAQVLQLGAKIGSY